MRVAEVHFGNGRVETAPFVPASEWTPKESRREGDTLFGQGIEVSLALFRKEVSDLGRLGVPINRSIAFVLTDGGATDQVVYGPARLDLHKAEQKEGLIVFPIAVGGYVPEIHRLSCKREAAVLKDGCFTELFTWIAEFLVRVSRSQPGETVPLAPLSGWAVV